MPDHIRLIGLIANGVLCATFGAFALFVLSDGQVAMVVFFALIAATGAFNWHVIRKSARVLAEQASQQAELQRQLGALGPPPGGTPPPLQRQGPTP